MLGIKKATISIAIVAALSLQAGCSTSPSLSETDFDDFDDFSSSDERVHENIKLSYPYRLEDLLNIESTSDTSENGAGGKTVVSNLRLKTVEDAAYSLGAQSGMAWRMIRINKYLEKNDSRLDRIYDFSRFLIDGKVLFPVIMESDRMYHQESETRARTVSVSYILSKSAKIVPSAPSWREYLSRDVINPKLPNKRLYPVDSVEIKAWRENVYEGWVDGIKQADEIFTIDQRRLHRDYTGMQKFKMLVQKNLVSMPELAVGEFGVVKDGKTLNVNDVIYEITMESDFTEKENWNPIFRP
ncbi:MAG: type IV secretory system conjugative DNA transfer family protein [Methylococcales bacterium]